MSIYRYLGDRLTAPRWRSEVCESVKRDGKCIVGGSKMLVRFDDGSELVVLRRRLRKVTSCE